MLPKAINLTTSDSGYVVPSRLRVDGPRSPAHIRRCDSPLRPTFPHFHFLTQFNGFNGFIFSPQPGITQPIPDTFPPHPGFFLRKSFQSHILPLHPTFREAEPQDWSLPASTPNLIALGLGEFRKSHSRFFGPL